MALCLVGCLFMHGQAFSVEPLPETGDAVAEELRVMGLSSDRRGPLMAGHEGMVWRVTVRGGDEPVEVSFFSDSGAGEIQEQKGTETTWTWNPNVPGTYRFRVEVRDRNGAVAVSAWSEDYVVVPKLVVDSLKADRAAPQAARMNTVSWSCSASGGVGTHYYTFKLRDSGKEETVQEGILALWSWSPTEPGTYQVKVTVRDALGNTAESAWSPEYSIAPELKVETPVPGKPAPQTADTVIPWRAQASGGVGARSHELVISDGTRETLVSPGPAPVLDWVPGAAGNYRVKSVVTDALGNRAESPWSPEYPVVPALRVVSLTADRAAPQTAEAVTIHWEISAQGGVGERRYAFFLSDETGESKVQESSEPAWDWSPERKGTYRLRAVVWDSLGNQADSDSKAYEILPRLEFVSLEADPPAPQPAVNRTIRWKAAVNGGVPPLRYEFYSATELGETLEKKGIEPEWEWRPLDAGRYKIRLTVVDAVGNRVEGRASSPYVVSIPVDPDSVIAVLPIMNFSATKAPLSEIRDLLVARLKATGLNLVQDEVLEPFMERHRMRYTGGISRLEARTLPETGADAVLVTVLELYDEESPPRVGLISRLVLTGDIPFVVWLQSADLTGDQAPGLLGLGRVDNVDVLIERAVSRLGESLTRYLSSGDGHFPEREDPFTTSDLSIYEPKVFWRSPALHDEITTPMTVAAVPFLNRAERKYAGDILQLHCMEPLVRSRRFRVLEPGLVRDVFLMARIMVGDGLSLADADIVFSETDADLLLTGKVFDYVTGLHEARVDFSTQAIARRSQRVVWTSKSYNAGDEGVYFFDRGRIYTAPGLAERMSETLLGEVLK